MITIAVDTLRAWLDEQQPVTILDVRPTQDYAEWCIPGSIHVDAYDALKAHDPAALFGVDLPADQPVVTACGVGRTSQIAAEQLQARGVRALSLEGGMQAWSLAWNTAERCCSTIVRRGSSRCGAPAKAASPTSLAQGRKPS
jgi:rhodanese-related sulfurtransferase